MSSPRVGVRGGFNRQDIKGTKKGRGMQNSKC
jgi:hypothetical protein